jgi:hypothetical protein
MLSMINVLSGMSAKGLCAAAGQKNHQTITPLRSNLARYAPLRSIGHERRGHHRDSARQTIM